MTPIPRLDGMAVIVDRYACQQEFVGWRRVHRKKRINKKWRKKYGPALRCTKPVYRIAGKVLFCPCSYAEFRRAYP